MIDLRFFFFLLLSSSHWADAVRLRKSGKATHKRPITISNAESLAKVPRTECAASERSLGEEYCEARCQDYEYGELPILQIGHTPLGSGSFGEVRPATMDDGKDVIVKSAVMRQIKSLKNEALQYKNLRGIPGIPDLIYAGPLPQEHLDMAIVVDKLDMSLQDYINYWKRGRHPEEQRWPQSSELATIARELLKILEQVHKKGYRHRDIKPENMMFKDGTLYLIDFGSTCPIGQDVCNVVGSPPYVSAHSWMGLEQNVKDDLESLVNLVVFHSGHHTWDECYEELYRGPVQVCNCFNPKKLEYLAEPTSCGVAGFDHVAEMIRSFDPASGDFDYDAAIQLLTDHSPLRFPTRDQIDAEKAALHAEQEALWMEMHKGVSGAGSSLTQYSTSLSMSSVSYSFAGSLPFSSFTRLFSNSSSSSITGGASL